MADSVEKKTQEKILDIVLTHIEEKDISCTVIFINGFQMHSVRFLAHDEHSILVEREGKQEVIFQHAISTIEPFSPVYHGRAKGGGTDG